MLSNVETLVRDIYDVIGGDLTPLLQQHSITVDYSKWFVKEPKVRKPKNLYFSEVGDPCKRRLWYKYNNPHLATPYSSKTLLKFFYGDILEELVLTLADDAGHEVTRKQERFVYEVNDGWSVTGKIDAVIDGVLVDVKSVTKYSEEKFKNGLKDDPFGYYSQLNGYAAASNHSSAGFLTIQKELGYINYYPIKVNNEAFDNTLAEVIEAVSTDSPEPHSRLLPVSASKTNENLKLCTTCSYCDFKEHCWPEMRTFMYSNGPEFLVKVVSVPKVKEV